MEKTFLVKNVIVKLICDTENCGHEMELVKESWGSYFSKIYHYKCPVCGATQTSDICYPEMRSIPTNTPVLTK